MAESYAVNTPIVKAMIAVMLAVSVGGAFLAWYPFLFSLAWPGLILARFGVRHSWLFVVAFMLGVLLWLGLRSRHKPWWEVGLASVLVPASYCAFAFLYVARLPVPLPKTTPYDSVAAQRAGYLHSFDAGYRDGLTGRFRTYCFLPEAETRGFYEGAYHGRVVWYRLLGRRMPDRERHLVEGSAMRDGSMVDLMNEPGNQTVH